MISLYIRSLLPLLLLFFDIQLLPEEYGDVEVLYWRNATNCYLFLVLYKIIIISFNVSL